MLNDLSKQFTLFITPVAVRKVGLLDAKPLEHAAVARNSWYESSNSIPILNGKLFINVFYIVLITVF